MKIPNLPPGFLEQGTEMRAAEVERGAARGGGGEGAGVGRGDSAAERVGEGGGLSLANPREVDLVSEIVCAVLTAGEISPEQIGVITPYAAQVCIYIYIYIYIYRKPYRLSLRRSSQPPITAPGTPVLHPPLPLLHPAPPSPSPPYPSALNPPPTVTPSPYPTPSLPSLPTSPPPLTPPPPIPPPPYPTPP